MWRVINAVPSDDLSDTTRTKAAVKLMAFIEEPAEGFPSGVGARASRKERQNAEKDAGETAAADKAEKEKAWIAASKQERANEKQGSREGGTARGTSASRAWGPCPMSASQPQMLYQSEPRDSQQARGLPGQHDGRPAASTVCRETSSQNVTMI